MSDIKWQTPPPRSGGKPRSNWPEIFTALRERPGEWALVCVGAAPHAHAIRNGIKAGSEPGEFEAVCRKRPDGKYDIYARYPEQVSA